MKMFKIVMYKDCLGINDTSTMYLRGDYSPVVMTTAFGNFYYGPELIYRARIPSKNGYAIKK